MRFSPWLPARRLPARPKFLLRSAEQPQHNPGGRPIIILVKISPERSPVIVHIEQTYLNFSGQLHVQTAANLIRENVLRCRVAASPGDGDVGARSPNQAFHKWSQSPAVWYPAENSRSPMISVHHALNAANGHEVVAAVRNDLQPRFQVPAERPNHSIQVA